MQKSIKVFAIRNKETQELWSTPKGKVSWSSVGAAKNAWSCHHYNSGTFKNESFNDQTEYEVVQLGEYKPEPLDIRQLITI
jgi:hypothetical protein